jgi:hypothetical protein
MSILITGFGEGVAKLFKSIATTAVKAVPSALNFAKPGTFAHTRVIQAGKLISTARGQLLAVGSNGKTSIAPRASSVRTRSISTKGNNTLDSKLSIVEFIWKWCSSIAWALFSFFVFVLGKEIAQRILGLGSPLSHFFLRIDTFLMYLRHKIDSYRDADRKYNKPSDFLKAIPTVLIILVQITVEFIMACLEFVILFISGVFGSLILLFFLYALANLLTLIEHNYVDMLDGVNTATVAAENLALQGGRMLNVSLDVWDAVAPYKNEEIRNMIESSTVLCTVFCPDDVRTGARRLADYTSNSKLKPYIRTLASVVRRMTFFTFVQNRFKLAILTIVLFCLKPFLTDPNVILDPLQIITSKLSCLLFGGFRCGPLEIINFVANAFVKWLNGWLPVHITFNNDWACKAGELEGISAQECGGLLSDLTPKGATFVNLVNTRRLSEVTREAMLECNQHPLDGSWIERLNGKIVHKSKYNKCPLSRHVFRDEFSNVKQFNRLDIHDECYTVCLHQVAYRSCHSVENGHMRELIGGCGGGEEIVNEHQARRSLTSLFPDSLFTWTKRPEIKVEKVERELSENPLHFTTSEQLIAYLQKGMVEKPTFTVNGMTCTLSPLTGLTYPQIEAYLFCRASLFLSQHMDQVTVYLRSMVTKPTTPSDFRRSLSTATPQWQANFKEKMNEVTSSLQSMRKYIRLLHSTDKTLDLDERIDDMIEVVNYRPSRRMLMERTERGLQAIEVKNVGWCSGENMFPCVTGECVPMEDRDLCPVADMNDPETGFMVKMGSLVQAASTMEIDPQAIFEDAKNCYGGYSTNPGSIPTTASNMENGDGEFCIGMAPPNPLRAPSIEIQGINRLLSTQCVNEFNQNMCQCDYFWRTALSYENFGMTYTNIDIWRKTINALMWVHSIFQYVFDFFNPGLELAWMWFLEVFASLNQYPRWVVFFFDNLGYNYYTPGWKLVCTTVYSGSFFTLAFITVIMYKFIWALTPIGTWYWTLVHRLIVFRL